MKNININIDVERLVDWYYNDSREIQELGSMVKAEIEDGDTFSISWESCWDSMGYIPSHIIRQDSLDKYGIDDCSDFEDWEHYDKIKNFVFFNNKGKEIARKDLSA